MWKRSTVLLLVSAIEYCNKKEAKVTFDHRHLFPRRKVELHFLWRPSHQVHSVCVFEHILLLQLLHSVECATSSEPFNLSLVESVVQYDCFLAPIRMLDDALHRL